MMASGTMKSRRSGRVRHTVKTYYDEARQDLEVKLSSKITTGSRKPTSTDTKLATGTTRRRTVELKNFLEDDDEIPGDLELASSNDDDEKDDSDASVSRKKKKTLRISRSPKTLRASKKSERANESSLKKSETDTTHIVSKMNSSSSYASMGSRKRKLKAISFQSEFQATNTVRTKSAQSSLSSLAKKVLRVGETPETSLVAALLECTNNKLSRDLSPPLHELHSSSQPSSIYTSQLYVIAQKVVTLHNINPNAAQVQLLNLIFRSVGGTSDSLIDPSATLDDLNNDDWIQVITRLVEEMRRTPSAYILLCADPNGTINNWATENSAKIINRKKGEFYINDKISKEERFPQSVDHSTTPVSTGVREYQKIYEEFWYLLGVVALTEGNMSLKQSHDLFTDDEAGYDDSRVHSKRKKGKADFVNTVSSTSRFDSELVRELLSRLIDLSTVGQPDIRAAGTVAALQLGLAVTDRTVVLIKTLENATRQHAAASLGRPNNGRKAESLRNLIDSLKRNRNDLEEILSGAIIESVFSRRYRDVNPVIRVVCLNSLSLMMVQRPDLFMVDKYSKYLGWMLSDKCEVVRFAALNGLLSPFNALDRGEINRTVEIDLSRLENLVTKFLKRIADCVLDVCHEVQEKAMSLLLYLLKNSFLDEVEDESIWNQINLRAIAHDTTATVRRDALYFIIEQLPAFDDNVVGDERHIAQRLDAIASWVAHQLTDGPIPIGKINIHLVDYVVHSLRLMSEHKVIVTNWSVLLRAIRDDSIALTSQGSTAGDRVDVAKQRILVRMLVVSAKAELQLLSNKSVVGEDIDPDCIAYSLLNESAFKNVGPEKATAKYASSNESESLSLSLLRELPTFLEKFKSDACIMQSLVTVPLYLAPTVFSLASYKGDFNDLLKNLGDTFLTSSDESVLHRTMVSLLHIAGGDHARVLDAKATMKTIVRELHERILSTLASDINTESTNGTREEPANRASKMTALTHEDTNFLHTSPVDSECSLLVNLSRLRILCKRVDVSSYFGDNILNDDKGFEDFCDAIAGGLARRLSSSKSAFKVCTSFEPNLCYFVAAVIEEGLQTLLLITAWKLLAFQIQNHLIISNDHNVLFRSDSNVVKTDDISLDNVVLHLRNRLLHLMELCFEQYLPMDEREGYSREMIDWSELVQEIAGCASSDLRSLFPKEWSDAASPLLQALSISNETPLIAGYVRYFRSKEDSLRVYQSSEKGSADEDAFRLLLPICRTLAVNWKAGNRREASVALSHLHNNYGDTHKFVGTLSMLLKQVDPVRLLEAQMASLRHNYEQWMENEPEEIEGDRPTDEQLAAFEQAESKHRDQFHDLGLLAQQFSMSLGVRKLSDDRLGPALVGFIREGVRYAFSNTDDNGEELYVVGSRLSFLLLLNKYANWLQRNKALKEVLEQDLTVREHNIRCHEDYDEVHSDDIKALYNFRETYGLRPSVLALARVDKVPGGNDESVVRSPPNNAVTPELSSTFTASRTSHFADQSMGMMSIQSRISSLRQSSLSPLYEEVEGKEIDEMSSSHQKATLVVEGNLNNVDDDTDGSSSDGNS